VTRALNLRIIEGDNVSAPATLERPGAGTEGMTSMQKKDRTLADGGGSRG
jgi:hypothetical protein